MHKKLLHSLVCRLTRSPSFPWTRTATALHRASATVGPSMRNDVLTQSVVRFQLGSHSPSSLHCLKTCLFSWDCHAGYPDISSGHLTSFISYLVCRLLLEKKIPARLPGAH